MSVMDVVWGSHPHQLEMGVLLVNGAFRVYELSLTKCIIQCTQVYPDQEPQPDVSTIKYKYWK